MSGLILPHQRETFEQLLVAAQAYFAGGWQGLPIKPRWARLLVAPTGAGKSHLVRAVASACGAQFFPRELRELDPDGLLASARQADRAISGGDFGRTRAHRAHGR